MPEARRKHGDATFAGTPPLHIVKTGDTWQMMVAVVKRAIRVTHPPVTERTKTTTEKQVRRDSLMLEDHYALLVAAGY